jgi:hypothetical protein
MLGTPENEIDKNRIRGFTAGSRLLGLAAKANQKVKGRCQKCVALVS